MTGGDFRNKLIEQGSSDLLVEFLGYDFAGKEFDLADAVDEVLAQMPDDIFEKFCKMLERDVETRGQYWE